MARWVDPSDGVLNELRLGGIEAARLGGQENKSGDRLRVARWVDPLDGLIATSMLIGPGATRHSG